MAEKEESEKKLKSLKNKKTNNQEKSDGPLQNFFKNIGEQSDSNDCVSDLKSRIHFQQSMLQKVSSLIFLTLKIKKKRKLFLFF